MKKALIPTLFFLYIGNLQSQVLSTSDSMPVAGKLKYSLFDNGLIINKTDKGVIYALLQDHMPVLRPDTTMAYHMPNNMLKKFPFNLYPSFPRVLPEGVKHLWKEIIIQTPDGPKTFYNRINPPKLTLPNRQ